MLAEAGVEAGAAHSHSGDPGALAARGEAPGSLHLWYAQPWTRCCCMSRACASSCRCATTWLYGLTLASVWACNRCCGTERGAHAQLGVGACRRWPLCPHKQLCRWPAESACGLLQLGSQSCLHHAARHGLLLTAHCALAAFEMQEHLTSTCVPQTGDVGRASAACTTLGSCFTFWLAVLAEIVLLCCRQCSCASLVESAMMGAMRECVGEGGTEGGL